MADVKITHKSKTKYTLYKKGVRVDAKSPFGLLYPCVLVVGNSGSGKTTYCINMIKKRLTRKYDRIYLIASSADSALINELDIDPDFIFNDVNDINQILTESDGDSKIIILDDMIASLKDNESIMRLVIACHHHSVCLIITAHSSGSEIAPIIKKNHHALALMPGLSAYDIRNISMYSPFNKKQLEASYAIASKKKLPLTLANVDLSFMIGFDKYKFV